ncbi:MAG: response regulator, partial [Chloroflexota bacterium]|nr:response regulator [Chloroflexota bacterium]
MSNEKILIIEDEENILEAVKYTLTQEGYDVFTSVDGEDGLKKAQKIKPDLVLLDVMLPKMDGFEVCRILRKDLEMPVFMISAKAEEIDRVVGLEIGADDYITKPFSMRELVVRVRNSLRRVTLSSQID